MNRLLQQRRRPAATQSIRTSIPIAGDEVLARYDRVHAIITSWNLADTLRKALLAINPRIEFLNPYEET